MVEAPSEGGGIDAVTQLFGGGAAEIGADVSSQESLITPLFTKVRRERERESLCMCMCALCPARRPLSARRVSGEGVTGEAAGKDRRVAGPSAFLIRQNVSPVARPPLRDELC